MFEALPSYRKYLIATLASRVRLESMLEASGVEALVPDWAQRRIVPQLLEDLHDLGGGAPMPVEATRNPVDMAAIVGTLYVLEGSGLGATILLKQAVKLGMSETFGARHLVRQVSNQRSWRDMLQTIETTPVSDEDGCDLAAITAFAVFESDYRKVFANDL